MRLTIVTPGLEGGGAESSMRTLSNLWLKMGKQVSVVVISFDKPGLPSHRRSPPCGSSPRSDLNASIPITVVDVLPQARKWPPRLKTFGVLIALRKAIIHNRPDVVIAFIDTVAINTLLATIGSGIPVIVSERCDPHTRPLGASTVSTGRRVLGPRFKLLEILRKLLYPRAASVVCLTDSAMAFFPKLVRAKGKVIPSPVLPPAFPAERSFEAGRRIVYLGRLTAVKGVDRLLRAYAKIASRRDDWKLELWGGGEEEQRLRRLVCQLGIGNRVFFRGWTKDPHAVLQGADLFVMSSHTEGFPVALCEAMACGVTPISFDCPSGPRHIIRHGIDGFLVPNGDVDGLASAMEHLIENEVARDRLASRAPEVLERFGAGKVLVMWEELLTRVRGRKKRHRKVRVSPYGQCRNADHLIFDP